MTKNVGGLDRFYRFGIGFLSLALVFVTDHLLLKVVFALVALIGIGTAAIGYCPLNAAFRVDTRKTKS
ncbi:MAG: DUF2892 domain-containing protein [Nitrospiria bacterium]